MSKKYKKNLEFKQSAIGDFVCIDGDDYHVFLTGQGEDTLVFLAGEAVPSPILDFKPLWRLLKDKFKIVVLEKAGYGFSDVTDKPRDVTTLVSDNRAMLQKLNISPPYVLIAHSYAGLEATYWAQKYTNEVKAIVSLDMTIPSFVDIAKIPPIMKLVMFFSRIFKNADISEKRAIKLTEKFPSFKHPYLNKEDKETYLRVIRHRFMTINMVNEIKLMTHNADVVNRLEYPRDVPLLFFSSDLIDAAKNAKKSVHELLQLQNDFIANFYYKKHIILDCDHFVHAHKSESVAEKIDDFLSGIVI